MASVAPPWREMLVAFSALVSLGTMTELALIGHWHGRSQLIAWVIAYADLAAAWAVAEPTKRQHLLLARVLAGSAAVGGVVGVCHHLAANWAFASELHPDASVRSRAWDAASGGIPLLAPMAVTVPAVLVAFATFGHPALATSQRQREAVYPPPSWEADG